MRDFNVLIRGASPLGLPYTVARPALRRLAPFAWLARAVRPRASLRPPSPSPSSRIHCRHHDLFLAHGGIVAVKRQRVTRPRGANDALEVGDRSYGLSVDFHD